MDKMDNTRKEAELRKDLEPRRIQFIYEGLYMICYNHLPANTSEA